MGKQIEKTGFEKYLGTKVLVNESEHVENIGGKECGCTIYDIAAEDTSLNELTAEAKGRGLQVRTWLPNTIGTMELRDDRLNVRIEKQDSGSFEITRVYIG